MQKIDDPQRHVFRADDDPEMCFFCGKASSAHGVQPTKEAHPDRYVDRRTLPKCAQAGCRRKVSALPDGHTKHCYEHASREERSAYVSAWSKAA